MATTHDPSENNYLAATLGNDQIYGCEGDDTPKTDARPTKKVLILQSLLCNSTAAGGDNPDQISLIIQDNNKNSWKSRMSPGQQVTLPPWNQDFHSNVDIELFAGSTSLGRENVSDSEDSPLPFTEGKADYTLEFQIDIIAL